jgi:hypothetical protein
MYYFDVESDCCGAGANAGAALLYFPCWSAAAAEPHHICINLWAHIIMYLLNTWMYEEPFFCSILYHSLDQFCGSCIILMRLQFREWMKLLCYGKWCGYGSDPFLFANIVKNSHIMMRLRLQQGNWYCTAPCGSSSLTLPLLYDQKLLKG